VSQFWLKNILVQHHHHSNGDRSLDLIIREPVKIVQLESEIRDVTGKIVHRTGQQRGQSYSVFRPFFSAMADQQFFKTLRAFSRSLLTFRNSLSWGLTTRLLFVLSVMVQF
jgi:uncharacterized membrane protein